MSSFFPGATSSTPAWSRLGSNFTSGGTIVSYYIQNHVKKHPKFPISLQTLKRTLISNVSQWSSLSLFPMCCLDFDSHRTDDQEFGPCFHTCAEFQKIVEATATPMQNSGPCTRYDTVSVFAGKIDDHMVRIHSSIIKEKECKRSAIRNQIKIFVLPKIHSQSPQSPSKIPKHSTYTVETHNYHQGCLKSFKMSVLLN